MSAKGRLAGKRGSISGRPPENEPFIWLTRDMVASTLWGALSISARRILDALIVEHLANGGRENGNLAATYLQLKAFGVTRDDIRRGLLELEICGFIRVVKHGFRIACGGEPSRYALTWQVTFLHSPNAAAPTDDWREVLRARNRAGQTSVREVRRWLKEQVNKSGVWQRSKARPKRGRVTQDIEGTPQVRADDRSQVRAETSAEIIPLSPQVRAEAARK